MTTPIIPSENDVDRPLFDLSGLVAGIRWRRRLWASLTLIGLLLGVGAATVLPTRASATADVFITHENEASGDGQSLMKTDLALLQTTTVAAVAVDNLKSTMTPENFVSTYAGAVVADNILEITARGADDAEAMARVQAVADAFIAVHIKQSADAAAATVKAYIDRRDQVQKQLDDLNTQITAASSGADLQTLYNRRGSLASQIASLTQQAEAASIGSPQVAAGTKILDAPHRTSHGFLTGLVLYGGIGLGAGLALGFLIAAVAAVVRNRPVLRRDIVAHLGASVVAQIPAPLRGPRKLIRRASAEKERARTAATLVRLVRESPRPVSVLELGSTRAAAALVKDMAEELVTERPVVLVDDLRGDEMTAALGPDSQVELVPGTEFPPAKPTPRDSRTRQLAIGTVGPGTPWTDLRRLGAEALVIVRAGRTDATWLHTVARQLADAGIAIIGLVVVHPDPRDKSDGTLWDALHTAVRGRVSAGGRALAVTPPAAVMPNIPVQAGPHRQVGARPPMGRPAPSPEIAARQNGNGARRPDATPPTEAIPVGRPSNQIDSPTMVIPINRDRTAAMRPANPAPPRPAPARPGATANGSAANGSAANGSAGNGSAANGSASNGSAGNVSAANGSAARTSGVNGSAANGSGANGSAANGSSTSASPANGSAANGTGTSGSVTSGSVNTGSATSAPAPDATSTAGATANPTSTTAASTTTAAAAANPTAANPAAANPAASNEATTDEPAGVSASSGAATAVSEDVTNGAVTGNADTQALQPDPAVSAEADDNVVAADEFTADQVVADEIATGENAAEQHPVDSGAADFHAAPESADVATAAAEPAPYPEAADTAETIADAPHFDAPHLDTPQPDAPATGVPDHTADRDAGDEPQRFDPSVPIARRPRPRPRPRPRLAFTDHPTDKLHPVVPGTPANKEAT